jgi:acetolactate synthase small subunit
MNRVLSEVAVATPVPVEPAAKMRRLDLKVADRPGVMVAVCQVFALLNVNIDTLKLETEGVGPNIGEIIITIRTDDRSCDLVCRKLLRSLDVLEVVCS